MADVDKIVKETKTQLKRFEGEIAAAKRLTKLLERSGLPVPQEKARISEMEDQARMVRKALKKDKEDQQ